MSKRLAVIGCHLAPAFSHPAPLMQDQVAVITGSGQGIGRSTALLFAQHGACVVVSDLDTEKSASVAEEINRAGGQAISISGDVTSPEFADRVLSGAVRKFGKVTCLVNNAGYTWDAVIHKMTDEQWDAMINVHNTAVFRLVRACGKYMREPAKQALAKGEVPEFRSIVNVSSTSGLHGNFGQASYSLAKAGVLGLSKTIAKEWGPFGIRCNAIAFGHITTRLTADKEIGQSIKVGEKDIALGIPKAIKAGGHSMQHVPLRRAGSPDEAAAGILVLASPQLASYVTGHTLEVTGGAGI